MIPACRVMVSEPPGVQAPSGSLHLRLLLLEGKIFAPFLFLVLIPYQVVSRFSHYRMLRLLDNASAQA